jgi:hypothetical protein
MSNLGSVDASVKKEIATLEAEVFTNIESNANSASKEKSTSTSASKSRLSANSFPFEKFPRSLFRYILVWLIDLSESETVKHVFVVATSCGLFGYAKNLQEKGKLKEGTIDYISCENIEYVDLRRHKCERARGFEYYNALRLKSMLKVYGMNVLFDCIDFGEVYEVSELKDRMRKIDDNHYSDGFDLYVLFILLQESE